MEPHESATNVLAFHSRARVAADEVIGELEVDDAGTAWSGETVSMRWVLVHMIEEIARARVTWTFCAS